MKNRKSVLKRVAAASFSAALLIGMIPLQSLTGLESVIAPAVFAEEDEGEGPLMPCTDPVSPSGEKPDKYQDYREDVDKVVYKDNNTDLPYIPSGATSSGIFTGGGSWSYYGYGSAYLTFNGSTIPAEAISAIYEKSEYAITLSTRYNLYNATTIGNDALNLTLVNLSDNDLALTTLSFGSASNPDGSTVTIGDRAFAGITTVNSLELPMPLTAVGEEAFYELDVPVTFMGNKPIAFGADAFAALGSDKTVVIPYNSTYDGQVIVPVNGKFPAVFGEATVRVKDEYFKVDAVEPTCEKSGNIEYYIGPNSKYYKKTSSGTYKQITRYDIVINKTGHDYENARRIKWGAIYEKDEITNTYPDTPKELQAYKVKICDICGNESLEKISSNTLYVSRNCLMAEKRIYWVDYTDENGDQKRTIRQLILGEGPLGHDYGAPAYVWSDDNSTVTATRVCSRNAEHKEEETVNTVSETDEQTQKITYTATFSNAAFATQTKTVDLASGLSNCMTVSPEATTAGTAVTITGAAEGGYAPYTYAVDYKVSGDTAWRSAVEFTSDTEMSYTPEVSGKHYLRLTVRDAKNQNKYLYVTLTVS